MEEKGTPTQKRNRPHGIGLHFAPDSVILGLSQALGHKRNDRPKDEWMMQIRRIFNNIDFLRIFRLGLLAAMLAAGIPAPVLAQTGDLLSENGNWQAYRAGKGEKKVCFITSQPTKYEGQYDRNNRGETRVFVTHHSSNADERGVVSTVAGYRYKEGRDVVFNIDGKTFNLFSVDTRAWATKPQMDQQLVRAMKRGNSLKVTGISSLGNTTIDTYSLNGFTAAMKVIDKACP